MVMTDDAPAIWNAWSSAFGVDYGHRLCLWHLRRAWKTQLRAKVTDEASYLSAIGLMEDMASTVRLEDFIPLKDWLLGMLAPFPDAVDYLQVGVVGHVRTREVLAEEVLQGGASVAVGRLLQTRRLCGDEHVHRGVPQPVFRRKRVIQCNSENLLRGQTYTAKPTQPGFTLRLPYVDCVIREGAK